MHSREKPSQPVSAEQHQLTGGAAGKLRVSVEISYLMC